MRNATSTSYAQQTGVTATYDPIAQKISLSGISSFYVSDVVSAGATNAGNLTAVLHLGEHVEQHPRRRRPERHDPGCRH